MAFAESRPTVIPPRRLPTGWPDYLLTAAAAVGLFVSIHDWFDRMSGIQKEPGTMLVIVACGLILAGAVLSRYPWRSVDGYIGHSPWVQLMALIATGLLTIDGRLLRRR